MCAEIVESWGVICNSLSNMEGLWKMETLASRPRRGAIDLKPIIETILLPIKYKEMNHKHSLKKISLSFCKMYSRENRAIRWTNVHQWFKNWKWIKGGKLVNRLEPCFDIAVENKKPGEMPLFLDISWGTIYGELSRGLPCSTYLIWKRNLGFFRRLICRRSGKIDFSCDVRSKMPQLRRLLLKIRNMMETIS